MVRFKEATPSHRRPPQSLQMARELARMSVSFRYSMYSHPRPLAQGRVIGSRLMETGSIRHFLSHRLNLDPLSLPSRKFTPLLVGRVDSPEPWEALSCTVRTSGHPVTMERTSPTAGSSAPLLPRVQLTDNVHTRMEKRCRVEVSDAISQSAWVFSRLKDLFRYFSGDHRPRRESRPDLGTSPMKS